MAENKPNKKFSSRNSESGAGRNGARNANKKRGPRRRRRNPSQKSEGQIEAVRSESSKNNARQEERGSHKKNINRNRRPKSLTPARILQKYDNLLDQHIVARRKFYEMHGRAQGRQLDKIESNFEKTLEALRSFERSLKDWQRDVLKQKIDAYPEDRQFSQTHGLEAKGDDVAFSGEFEDPHLLPFQKESDFSGDTEESVGTIEDYKRYKEQA